jgi:hypothetical protein
VSVLFQELRLEGTVTSIKARAPAVAGNIAAWGGLLSAFNCVAVHYRQKEDGWNNVLAGAGSGGCIAVRSKLFVCFQRSILAEPSANSKVALAQRLEPQWGVPR